MDGKIKLKDIYNAVENSRSRYGKLKKCEIHFHTPASYDYRFSLETEYQRLDVGYILDVAVDQNYLSYEVAQTIKNEITEYVSEKYVQQLKESGKPFDSFKEYITYMLIAHKLYQSDVEVAVITDHNTIKGYRKLKYAINEYFKDRVKNTKDREAVFLFLGVEITCSEKNHLVAIFDENKFSVIQSFLSEIIISEQEGTYYTSHYLIEKIVNEYDGIAYLAHLNSSNLLGSYGYNKTLFSMKEMLIAGLSTLSKEKNVRQRIMEYSKQASKSLGFIYESDSHELETIGIQNTWIKFNEINFQSLKKAFFNFSISVYTEKPQISNKYIKGIVVESGLKGFLKAQEGNSYFVLEFSKDLNCIIGGRGTGKSTVLNTIETILTLETDNIDTLKFVSSHDMIYILFHLLGNDYIIQFIPQVEYHFSQLRFLDRAFEDEEMQDKLQSHWINLFRVKDEESFIPISRRESIEILQQIYRQGYSINNIIKKIDSGEISDFIKETIFYGVKYSVISDFMIELKRINKRSRLKFLRSNLMKMTGEIERRREFVEQK
ncbi:hypothetical protein FPL14_28895 [Cohnella cholangitidis]|uniref:Uncharacterized protein n=1 Tax=Cohnella cholangitidis TaxID=2598458 RepID=A0A7G5C6A0_9BACL|nr:AAA family ATPase [Cohnella cholangitidis]QMV44734.1 hypothetical protein FPL14_28895 [Cohnella cholangitidis]